MATLIIMEFDYSQTSLWFSVLENLDLKFKIDFVLAFGFYHRLKHMDLSYKIHPCCLPTQ